MPEKAAIAMRGVSFAFNGAPVLEGVEIEIPAGDFACLIGPNGGGKTTLLKLALGLLQPRSGEVRVLGVVPERARRHIGYVPQQADLDRQFPITVLDVVLMGRLGFHAAGRYRPVDRRLALAALAEMDMDRLAAHPFAGLSGGQRQRVLIARALCSEPQLLLLDEPTANVDPSVGARFLEVLRELNQRMTIVLVSHDLGFVSPAIKTVVCVNRRVVVHAMHELTGEHIRDIYGDQMCMVHHDWESHREQRHDD